MHTRLQHSLSLRNFYHFPVPEMLKLKKKSYLKEAHILTCPLAESSLGSSIIQQSGYCARDSLSHPSKQGGWTR